MIHPNYYQVRIYDYYKTDEVVNAKTTLCKYFDNIKEAVKFAEKESALMAKKRKINRTLYYEIDHVKEVNILGLTCISHYEKVATEKFNNKGCCLGEGQRYTIPFLHRMVYPNSSGDCFGNILDYIDDEEKNYLLSYIPKLSEYKEHLEAAGYSSQLNYLLFALLILQNKVGWEKTAWGAGEWNFRKYANMDSNEIISDLQKTYNGE